ncbi:methylmalonyl-CoA epimerase [Mycolicibacterium fallax]|uniref:Methylmalonyl-CoA epimerase n=1 Tax=Mycolicibacterium fallax TaxID=1793 RepID=A0A1X1RHR3_MYCFA|nr:methylmalonyl-CoA epimerase [Mycolicibacterium fallax]ORV06633.1 methylmalonyl-CoA epimerase [Mycolicibacterium fallax]BBY96575.1 methylmalonyl-CoA epimerase [Mycolicibacterium fallax]HOW93463.1 methylmalonyl-CoA epimerase [Mycolicibacterium fallax]HSA39940.1 methylmalonyl-CoA epimerase [Mycobacterium sp.]
MSTDQVDARSALTPDLVTAIDHAGIAVPDLEAAKTFYCDHLGMEVLHQEVNEEQGVIEAMLGVRGTPAGSTQIQLLAPLNEASTIAKFIGRSGPGLQQLCVRTSDVDALSDRLRAAGIRLLYETSRRGTAGARINFIHPKDAGGVLMELTEPPAQPAH